MNKQLRDEAQQIFEYAIGRVLPDRAVARALEQYEPSGKIYLAAVGKAAWQMADAAVRCLKQPIAGGVVVTKYGHVRGDIPGVRCFEGGHPIVDENGLAGTQAILDMTEGLNEEDHVLFLVSGGGSALFEKPLAPLAALQELNRRLLAAGASITEINTLRKRLSAVKGGRFARWCEPAWVDAVILSDVLGDPLDMIASGPAAPDPTTCQEALAIVERYRLAASPEILACLKQETPKELGHVSSQVIGSVSQLCVAAAEKCRELGYETHILTDRMCCEARDAGRLLASIAAGEYVPEGTAIASVRAALETMPTANTQALSETVSITDTQEALEAVPTANTQASSEAVPVSVSRTPDKRAYIAGGECVVHLRGKGLGGRNQELALAAAEGLAGIRGAAIFSVGSDGTDGPTDAAGGYVDGDSLAALEARGIRVQDALSDNDSYHALEAIGGLLKTGPTGTNVNDVSVVLIHA